VEVGEEAGPELDRRTVDVGGEHAATDAAVTVEHGDLDAVPGQRPGRAEAGHTGADDDHPTGHGQRLGRIVAPLGGPTCRDGATSPTATPPAATRWRGRERRRTRAAACRASPATRAEGREPAGAR